MLNLFKRIFKLQLKEYLIAFIFILVYYVLKLLPPFFIKVVVDALTNQTLTYELFIKYTIILILVPIGLYVTCAIWGFYLFKSSNLI